MCVRLQGEGEVVPLFDSY